MISIVEERILDYGLQGIVILALGYAVKYLFGRYEEIQRASIEADKAQALANKDLSFALLELSKRLESVERKVINQVKNHENATQ